MRSEMLIERPVLRSGNRPLGRMDTGKHAQFRRLMLYPTELRTAAKTSGLDAIFFIRFGYRSANSKRQELYAHEYKADQRIKSPVPHCWRGGCVMKFLRTLAQVVGWLYLLAAIGGSFGAWDFHVCLKAPAGACAKSTP